MVQNILFNLPRSIVGLDVSVPEAISPHDLIVSFLSIVDGKYLSLMNMVKDRCSARDGW